MVKVDYSARDKDVKTVIYVLIQKRQGITLNTFDSYWKNVHGPVSARIPGQYQYWQFHLAHNQGDIWSVTEEIEYKTPEENQLDGIAELTFLSEEDCKTWINAATIIDSDQQNFVSKAVIYVANNGNSKTYVDSIETGAPNGGLDVVKLHVMVQKKTAITVEDFRKYMVDAFASNIINSDLVLKFRLHLLEEHNNSLPPAPGVSHYEPLEKQYQAAFEIAFKNHMDMKRFFASEEYAAAVSNQTKYIKQIASFPERDTYTFVYDSKLTLAGQRTSTVAELIADLAATNQTEDNIVNLMLGKVVS
jgi:hypothetical protein